ncbi:MAG: amidohydrolase family protein [Anaerolineae bacterium]
MGPEYEQSYWDRIDGPIYRAEIELLLPDRVLDFHAHVWRTTDLASPPSEATRTSPSLVWITDSFSYQELQRTVQWLFPGKQYEVLCFGMPIPEMNVERNNEYVREVIRNDSNAAGLMLVRPVDKADQVRQLVLEGNFVGLKPYFTFVYWKAQNDVLLDDMLTADHLKVANELGLIVMIHLPRKGRLADPENIVALQRISVEYPRAKLIVAHVGRSYCEWSVFRGLKHVESLPNVYFDTTFIQNSVVFQFLFEHVDASRVMFGTDLPDSAVHGQVVCVNGINLFVTRDKYAWSLSRPDNPIECTYMAYESIRAIRDGAERAGLLDEVLRQVFYQNGRKLIDDVLANLEKARI